MPNPFHLNRRGALAIIAMIALALFWVRSSHRIDLLVIPVPGDHMFIAASAYGGVIFGFGRDARDEVGGTGFHSIDPTNGGDDSSDAGTTPAPDPTGAAGGDDDEPDKRLWLAPGLLQWQLLSGDNELSVEAYFAGFMLCAGREPEANGSLAIPYWFLIALVPMIIALRRLKQWRIARRQRRQLCAGCGYDLRGNASGVCPECGRAIPPAAGAATAPRAHADFETPVTPL